MAFKIAHFPVVRALDREAIRQGYSVLFATAQAVRAALVKAHGEGREGHLEAHAAHRFFQLVSRRYERGRLLITSNRSVGEWGEAFGDAAVVTAILDWLLHHSHVLTITGESCRLREKRRAGVLNAPTVSVQAAS